MNTFLHNERPVRVMTSQVAGTGDMLAGDALDMRDFHDVVYVAALGAITSTGTVQLKAQQSSDNGVTDGWSDIEGSGAEADSDDDGKILVLEVVAKKRYIRPAIVRATANAVIDGVLAIQRKPRWGAVEQSTTVADQVLVHNVVEGTA